jgi:hypothetical protein
MKPSLLVIVSLIVIIGLQQVLSKEYYSKTKWTSKDKLGKWNGGSKKKIVDAATIGSLEKTEKNKKLKLKGTRKEEDEKRRICQSYTEDTLFNFLLKFGTVTKLIDNISEFEMKLKAAEETSSPWRKKRLWKSNRGLVGDKYMSRSPFASSSSSDAVVGGGRSSFRQKQIKHNYLNEKSKKSKRKKVKMERSGESIVHACYGYNYLSSMGALETDPSSSSASPKMPDLDFFREFLMDLGDMELSDSLIKMSDRCMEENKRADSSCPALFALPPSEGTSPEDETSGSSLYSSVHVSSVCPESCLSHVDCAASELCCSTQCGGNSCFNPNFRSKYRSADAPMTSRNKPTMSKKKKFDATKKCNVADGFVQCLYDGIGQRICS